MIKLTYDVKGMTCGSCVASVKKALESHEAVHTAEINLENGLAIIQVEKTPGIAALQKLLSASGVYTISNHIPGAEELKAPLSQTATFKPLIIIFLFITGVSVLVQFPFELFDWMGWMRHFMAGFFLVFSFFKLLDVQAFAKSFAMYDPIAKRSKTYAKSYPFIELLLGLAYLTNIYPVATNSVTLLVMGIGAIGVIQAVMNKDEIQCACLGTVFKLPMTTVTIVEDLLMVVMAAAMLLFAA